MSNPFAKPFNQSGSFLPEDYVARKAETRANIITLTLFALVMAGVTGAFVVTTRTWHGLRQEHQALKAEYEIEAKKIDQLKALEAKRQEVLETAELTAALAERVPRWALLAELTLRMPPEMRRDMLTFKGKRITAAAATPAQQVASTGVRSLLTSNKPAPTPPKPKATPPQFEYQLTLAGTAMRNNDIADYIAALRDCPILKDVELQFIREAKEDEKVVRKFELLAMLKTDVDSKTLAESLSRLVASREASSGDSKKAPPAAPVPSAASEPTQTNLPSTVPSAPVAPVQPVPQPAPQPEMQPAPQGEPTLPPPAPPESPTTTDATPAPQDHTSVPENPSQNPVQPQ